MLAAVPAIPEKPNNPAANATTKKTTAQFNMIALLNNFDE